MLKMKQSFLCTATIGGYCTQPGECVCHPGFSGSLCGTCMLSEYITSAFTAFFFFLPILTNCPLIADTDPCSQQGSPCNEGTTCVNLGNSNYRCLCPSGYHGDHCQQSSDACSPNPCLNQGKCYVNGVANYTCLCPSRYKVSALYSASFFFYRLCPKNEHLMSKLGAEL